LIEIRDIEALFSGSLVEEIDDENAWKAVNELRSIGTREVFDFAIVQTKSASWIARVRAIDIIAQLGNCTGQLHPYRTEAGELIERMLHEEADLHVLHSGIVALGHLDYLEGVETICGFSPHPSADVRHAVAVALGGMADEDNRATSSLLQLMQDSDDDVRDWATFRIGVLSELDTPEIREALYLRLDDGHFETHCEAMAGLGKRKDMRVLPALLKYFDEGLEGPSSAEAATALLELDAEPTDWTSEMYAEALRKKYSK
jgi:hypothetical protein